MKKFLLRMAEYNCMESSINKLSQMNASIPRLIIGNKIIGEGNPVFFIAEIGQNHQGDVNIAKKLIDAAKESGADCVKLQKTDLNEKFTKQILDREYNSPNSWGRTYGEHKQYLEFSEDQFLELQQYAKCKDILFTASAMDLKSLDFLLNIDVPFVKIGSGDSNNIELIMKAAQSEVPIIISTGMLTFESVKKLDLIFRKYNKNNYALLHCVSAYPTPLEDVNLKVIELYRGCFPDIIIGYSGHELGIDVSIAATVMGAQIIERHITLDQKQKGSDHKCSLLPEEFRCMIDKVKKIQIACGTPRKIFVKAERECWDKLGKTIVAAKPMKAGDKIKKEDLRIKVADPKGIDGINFLDVVGATLKIDKDIDESIMGNDIDMI